MNREEKIRRSLRIPGLIFIPCIVLSFWWPIVLFCYFVYLAGHIGFIIGKDASEAEFFKDMEAFLAPDQFRKFRTECYCFVKPSAAVIIALQAADNPHEGQST